MLAAVLPLLLPPAPLPAQSFHPTVTKLHGRATNGQENNWFGNAVAVSDAFLLVGEQLNNAGAAHLYDARTGRYLRKLTAADGAADDRFGISVALSGNLVLVGAYRNDEKASDAGAAYVFDARTGNQLAKLTAADGAAGDSFGFSVALSDNLALVGAYRDADMGNSSGAAYVFDARSGVPIATGHAVPGKLIANDTAAGDYFGRSVALSGNFALIGAYGHNSSGSAYAFDARSGEQLHKFTANDAAVSDSFGFSVALSGNLALIGAPFDDDHGSNSGSAYAFDARSGEQLHKLTAAAGAAGDYLGISMAFNGNLALIGAYEDDEKGNNAGAAYVFDARTGNQLAKLTAPDGAADDVFGTSVALSGNLALIGAPSDDDHGNNSGSAYFFRPLAAPLPLARVAAKGSFAPGAPETAFNAFPQAFINPAGEAVLQATLSGPGAKGGRNRGVWTTLAAGGSLDPSLRVKDTDLGDGQKPAKILNAWSNNAWGDNGGNALIHAIRSGPGINSSNNQILYYANSSGSIPIARTGAEPPGAIFGGGVPQSFLQIVQPGTSQNRVTLNTRLKTGTGGVHAGNDSAVFSLDNSGLLVGTVWREGVNIAGTVTGTLGQIGPRVAESRDSIFASFSVALIPEAGPAVQTLFLKDNGLGLVHAASQGDNAPGIGPDPALFRAFLGETIASFGWQIWRASLSNGPGVSAKNNEGLWHQAGFLIARKGQEADPDHRPGVKIARILQFWSAKDSEQAVLLVKLSGPKIKGANDLALCLWDAAVPDALQILLQEGQVVEGSDAPAVRVIQRVDVEPGSNGHYAVLCSLTGAAAKNQALFTGRTGLGNATTQKILRLPALTLRKGTLYGTAATTTTTLRSLSLSPTTDATGAGGKGLGQIINENGQVALTLDFDNKAREVMKGVP